MNPIRLVYVAGRFSGATRNDVERNIDAAEQVGLIVARLGGMPVIPHANTAHPDFEKLQAYGFWINGTMALLLRCDALVTVPGWRESKGAVGEVTAAQENRMPVFHGIQCEPGASALRAYLEAANV